MRSKAASSSQVAGETEDYVSQLNKGTSNILVAVRARPLSRKERETDPFEVLEILDGKVVILLDPSTDAPKPEEAFRINRTKEKQYAFDFAFAQDSTQQEVYQKTTRFLLDGVTSGFNATVFAYGSTGAGKTYTMLGDQESPGLMLMTIRDLYRSMNSSALERSFKVKLSYLEIYNENIKDLISDSTEHLDIWEDPIKGITIAGLTEIQAASPQEVVDMVQMGNMRRTCEPTMANETSSRSHAVLQILIEHADRATGAKAEVVSGKLSLIDLAGSERASNTQNRGMRLIEGANINRSLLALGNCINALFFANAKGTKAYIPYRDSKLTRILKDSLGGNCRTVMIACISPNVKTFEDTHNTLKYANRAKNIKTNVQRNVLNVAYHVSQYTSIITSLKKEIGELRGQLAGRQRSVLPSIVSTEKYRREVEAHFEEENLTVKKMLETERNIEKLGLTLFARLAELNQVDTDFIRKSKLENEVKVLKSTVSAANKLLETEQNKLTALQKKRDAFEVSWPSSLALEQVQELRLLMKELTLQVSKALVQSKDDSAEAAVKQRESYILLLEGQLKIRDNIIDTQTNVMAHKKVALNREMYRGLVELEGLGEISTVAKVCFPTSPGDKDLSFAKSTSVIKRRDRSNSRIPLPKISKTVDYSSIELNRPVKSHLLYGSGAASPSMHRKSLNYHASTDRKQRGIDLSKKNSTNQDSSIASVSSEASSTAMPDQKAVLSNIADRVRKSPYVRRSDLTPGPQRNRSDYRNLKYAGHMRRLTAHDA
jgi:kinesin family protein 18/19